MKTKILLFFILLFSSCATKVTTVLPIPEHESVDLGLSVKWAKYNVGATKPEERGQFFHWSNNEENYMSSMNDLRDLSIINIKYKLTPNNDVASELWDNGWRTPTMEELKELTEKCTWEWSEYNGAVGQLVTGPNGNSIFLPFTGIGDIQWGAIYTSKGYYWSSSVANDKEAYYLYFDLSQTSIKEITRKEKLVIRAVKD